MNCFACDRIAQIKSICNPYFVSELEASYFVLADHQRYEGWCILLLKEHHEHLDQLPFEAQLLLFRDVARAARAVRSAFHPRRLNYECLGNSISHIHWHIIPRYDWDPQPESPIWVRPKEERYAGVLPERLSGLIADLKKHLDNEEA
jgi:diadenosine tetraphosphate (Ap4A) HIT family hydrolase